MARSVFLRGLAIVYLIAFASLLPQGDGLIGSNGILPVNDYLDTIDSEYGNTGYALFPTLACFDSSDTFLHVMIWAGMLLAILLLGRVLPLGSAIGLWGLCLPLTGICPEDVGCRGVCGRAHRAVSVSDNTASPQDCRGYYDRVSMPDRVHGKLHVLQPAHDRFVLGPAVRQCRAGRTPMVSVDGIDGERCFDCVGPPPTFNDVRNTADDS